MRTSGIYVCLILSFLCLSCDDEPTAAERNRQPKQAYDLAGLLTQEVETLAQAQVSVQKVVSKAGQPQETKTIRNVEWAQELASFFEADLNKPALQGLYTKTETTNAHGQTLRRYVAQQGASANLREAVYTFAPDGQLLEVNATIRQENMLFETLKQMRLQLAPGQSPRLQSYRLDETQELLWMEEEQYGVEGKILR